jgi:hypothetical protein
MTVGFRERSAVRQYERRVGQVAGPSVWFVTRSCALGRNSRQTRDVSPTPHQFPPQISAGTGTGTRTAVPLLISAHVDQRIE